MRLPLVALAYGLVAGIWTGACDGPRPLSTLDPGKIFRSAKRSGEATPGPLFGKHQAPLPTNAWWENMAIATDSGQPEGNIFQMPYVVLADEQGPSAMQPFPAGAGTESFAKLEALTFSTAEGFQAWGLESWDELTLTLQWQDDSGSPRMTVPLVRGSPYITAEFDEATPKIMSEQELASRGPTLTVEVDGQQVACDGNRIEGSVMSLEFAQSDSTWLLFSPKGAEWICEASPFSLTATRPFTGAVRAALANSCTTGLRPEHCFGANEGRDASGYVKLLKEHAGCYPKNTSVKFAVKGDVGRVTWNWNIHSMDGWDKAPLLQLAWPVHRPLLPKQLLDATKDNGATPFHDIRGIATAVVGDEWQLDYPLFPDVGLGAPRPVARGLERDILRALAGPGGALWNGSSPDSDFDLPLNYRLGVGDTYFSGKMLARLARLVVVADELGESKKAYFKKMVDRLAQRMEVWFHKDAETPFIYDKSWGGLLSCGCLFDDCEGKCEPHCSNKGEECPSLTMAGMNFGNGFYNDHHFHYGYFVYSAAVLAKFKPAWEKRWREQIVAVVRDYGNPSDEDPHFPIARHKDWFLGTSWAGGIPMAYQNGRNQESTSEAINSYYALYVYGATVEAPFAQGLRDFGRLLTAMESHGADTYWHIRKNSEMAQTYGEEFSHSVVGILWDHVVEHQTWFGGAPYIVSGIQLLPMTPVMEHYLKEDWVAQDSAVYRAACETDPTCADGWSWPMCLEEAVLDPAAAYMCLRDLPKDAFSTGDAASNGNSLTNSLHWIATRPDASWNVFGRQKHPQGLQTTTTTATTTTIHTTENLITTVDITTVPEVTTASPSTTTEELIQTTMETTDTSVTTTTIATTRTTVTQHTSAAMPTTSTEAPESTTAALFGESSSTSEGTSTGKSTSSAPESTSSAPESTTAADTTEKPTSVWPSTETSASSTTSAAITVERRSPVPAPTTTTHWSTMEETVAAKTSSLPSLIEGGESTKPPVAEMPTLPPSEAEVILMDAAVGEPVQSGDTIYLKAHTGSYLDVDGAEVAARWKMHGDWQAIIIEKDGGGTIWSDDTVFLKSKETQNQLDVQGNVVRARWHDKSIWQEFVIQKDNNDGAIWLGDTVFLTAHTGNCIDVQGQSVRARWNMHGPWQALTIEQEEKGKKSSKISTWGVGKDDRHNSLRSGRGTTPDPFMQWAKLGMLKQVPNKELEAALFKEADGEGDPFTTVGQNSAVVEEFRRRAELIDALKSDVMRKYQESQWNPEHHSTHHLRRLAVLLASAAFVGAIAIISFTLLKLRRHRRQAPYEQLCSQQICGAASD